MIYRKRTTILSRSFEPTSDLVPGDILGLSLGQTPLQLPNVPLGNGNILGTGSYRIPSVTEEVDPFVRRQA
jgi:hypothetical protein